MGSYQIWPYHMTQAENLSFLYLKSYCPLNLRKVAKFRGSAASLTEVIKKTICRQVEPPCGTGLRVYFCCVRTFSAMSAMTSLLGGKIFSALVSGSVVRLNICRWWWWGKEISRKTCCRQVLSKMFFIWARKGFLYPVTDFISE